MKDRIKAFMREQSTLVDETTPAEERIGQLERHVDRLAQRCSALESQNILVSVQVLDMAAQTAAWTCSLSSFAVYSYVVWWVTRAAYEHAQAHHVPAEELGGDQSVFCVLIFNPMSLWMLRLGLFSLPYLYNQMTYGSFHRRFEVFAIAFIVIVRTRLCRWRERMFMDKESSTIAEFGESLTEEAIWEANYEVSARFLYVSILRLKGLWTKTAQYLSSRADFMPRSYVRELKRLQDEAPATAWKDVAPLLPRNVLDSLTDIAQEPLASASIGQVHTAYLRSTGEKVVVKVQHPHARTLLLDDFWSLSVILRIVSWMEPDYEFLEILMREWAQEARKELDFLTEAQNLRDARAAIRQLWPKDESVVLARDADGTEIPFSVEIPRPMDDLCNNDVLVMNFCEGVRLDNFDRLKDWGLPRAAVLNAVAQTFGYMMYNTEIFNGDPHIGNMLIRPGTGQAKAQGFTLILLDWGLAKHLPEQKRLGFCKLVYAASTFDYGLMMDSYKALGLRLKKENVGRSMASVRFMLRDMATRNKARERIKAKIKSERALSEQNPKEDKVPIQSKAYPGEMFFFVRVNELLHGLGSRFDVDMKYLEILRPYAERGLRESREYNEVIKITAPVNPRPGTIDLSLEEKLQNVLTELETSKEIVGAQICVLDQKGETLTNLVVGSLGGLKSHIPMHPSALILGFSCTKAVTATLAHVMVREGYLSYDEPVCERVWQKFCPVAKPPPDLFSALGLDKDEVAKRWHWKRQISLWHILTHQAGMQEAIPTNITIKNLASCEFCSASFEFKVGALEETLLPTKAPGEEASYHALSFGWLVAGTLCGAYALRHSKRSATFEQVYEELLATKLSPETLSLGFRPCGGTHDCVLAETTISELGLSSALQRRHEMSEMGETEEDEDPSKATASEALKTFKGKEFLLDPRIWNSIDAFDANVPAAGGRFTASALAHFYHDLGSGRILDKSIIERLSSLVVTEKSGGDIQGVTSLSDDDRTALGCGYQLLRFNKDAEIPSGFGHAGVGGSIGAYHRPTGLAMALMLNKADGGKETTLKIMRVVSEHFDI
eukprot:scaffold337_cov172-Amphora_coffeaeformis.AAC.3